jgi:hypothetical protein
MPLLPSNIQNCGYKGTVALHWLGSMTFSRTVREECVLFAYMLLSALLWFFGAPELLHAMARVWTRVCLHNSGALGRTVYRKSSPMPADFALRRQSESAHKKEMLGPHGLY